MASLDNECHDSDDGPTPAQSEDKMDTQNQNAPETAVEPVERGWLHKYLARALGISAEPETVLEELTLEGVAKYISSGKCKNIITMAGAGISTSAGIPDFRTPGTGLYSRLQDYNLPNPEAIFQLDFFQENPKPFFVLAKELWPGSVKPTLCHYLIKMLYDRGLLLRHYTQNIDGLERETGLDPEGLVEAHGTFSNAHCTLCRESYTSEWVKDKVFADEIPRCTKKDCTGSVKPDIVFFGEALPGRFAECVEKDFPECDLLIILGTSLEIKSFSCITSRVPDTTPRLFINLVKTGHEAKHPISILMYGGGFKFDDEDNYRDVFWQGLCDDGCRLLARELGWEDELTNTMKPEHEKIDHRSTTVAKSTQKTLATPTAIHMKVKDSSRGNSTGPIVTVAGKAGEQSPTATPKVKPRTGPSKDKTRSVGEDSRHMSASSRRPTTGQLTTNAPGKLENKPPASTGKPRVPIGQTATKTQSKSSPRR